MNHTSKRPEVVLIVAATRNRVIGKDNDLIWHLPVDMRYFKETTKGAPVIMGRKNYESIPEKYRPLPGRLNIVLSHQADYPVAPEVWLRSNLEKTLSELEKSEAEKVFIIGGGQVYAAALEAGLVDRMLITWIDTELEGDAYFPAFYSADWQERTLMHHPADDKHAYAMQFNEYLKLDV